MGELLVKSRNTPGRLTSGCTRRLFEVGGVSHLLVGRA